MNYKVKIPKRFKGELSKRFDFGKTLKKKLLWGEQGIREIDIECPLCKVFNVYASGCRDCPFKKFATKKDLGCYRWVNRVIPRCSFYLSTNIWWKKEMDNEVKEQLSLLRKKAKELIEWV